MEQRTDEWFQARLGKVTASKVSDVMAKTKSGYSASRENYMAQLVVERMTNTQSVIFTNPSMDWGIQQEPFARAAYEIKQGVVVEEVGFIDHPLIKSAGASPDGLVGDDGLVEIKCPNTATHIETLLTQTVSAKYYAQMQWQMACTNRDWCDFVSFDPRMPEGAQLFITRVQRDPESIKEMEAEVKKFLVEVDSKVDQLKRLIG
jgi:putative phage-type endonuclease